jgi:hypothetical protein
VLKLRATFEICESNVKQKNELANLKVLTLKQRSAKQHSAHPKFKECRQLVSKNTDDRQFLTQMVNGFQDVLQSQTQDHCYMSSS